MARTFIIAEAGVNHNGDINIAKKLVDVAVYAAADAVKFQTWKTDLIVTQDAEMADYQKRNMGKKQSQYEMLKELELAYDDFISIKKYCDEKNIIFMSTPDEELSASFLNSLQDIFKIGSGELTNIPFLKHIASFGKKIILSTGMSCLGEVESAVSALLSSGLDVGDITLLHATSNYPTDLKDVNLLAMKTLEKSFPGVRVGYSDHTLGVEVSIAAVALGATIIEKHFTLDKTMLGPDHKASLEPQELKLMIDSIRKIETCLGNGWKVPTKSEIDTRNIVRKSLVAACNIKKGEIIKENMVTIKRPGGGMPPSKLLDIINSYASKDYREGELF